MSAPGHDGVLYWYMYWYWYWYWCTDTLVHYDRATCTTDSCTEWKERSSHAVSVSQRLLIAARVGGLRRRVFAQVSASSSPLIFIPRPRLLSRLHPISFIHRRHRCIKNPFVDDSVRMTFLIQQARPGPTKTALQCHPCRWADETAEKARPSLARINNVALLPPGSTVPAETASASGRSSGPHCRTQKLGGLQAKAPVLPFFVAQRKRRAEE